MKSLDASESPLPFYSLSPDMAMPLQPGRAEWMEEQSFCDNSRASVNLVDCYVWLHGEID